MNLETTKHTAAIVILANKRDKIANEIEHKKKEIVKLKKEISEAEAARDTLDESINELYNDTTPPMEQVC